ncbi:dTDP-glucose 4,6-dehydratase [Anatilimnocola aggregata]|uniref:dTDP-glucose 4,6-dehydratase n=1 Tax=Anatilimnocola aggregata TaxID=2528021 RepID=A0A517YN17_9BACT|nr:NAD-dependent epimerase/dehydratase family protein [Anatilimnocola aggregata]QDU31604.1 dTDP-glucose 4,6-dehydratase [Anatilimnocola aggregata]
MKYLITGATGLIGNNTVRQLLAQGEQVRVLTRQKTPLVELDGLNVEICHGDIRDAASVQTAVRNVDCVIHAAAHVQVGWTQQKLHQQVNVEGTRNVAAAACGQKVRLVHISTINTLGLGSLANPANEETGQPGLVPCHYATSKADAEKVVQQFIDRGLDAVIVHPSFSLGPWDWKPSSGRMFLAVNRGTVVAPSGAYNVSDVRDVSAGIAAAAKLAPTGRRYILGGHNLSYLDAWRAFAQASGKVGPRFRLGPIARCVASVGTDLWTRYTGIEGGVNSASLGIGSQETCFSSQRAEKELGYRIRNLKETVTDAWNWFCEHGYVDHHRSHVGRAAASFLP